MKILMLGRGVIASTYGWVLARAGHEVEFLIRPGRTAEYGAIELDLLDLRRRPWGTKVVESWPARYREELAADHDFDLVVVSVPHDRLGDAASFLAPRIGAATALILGNVWAEPLEAVAPLPRDQVVWGFPGAGGGFGGDGVLRVALTPSVVLGTLGGAPSARDRAVHRMFRAAGVRVRVEPDMRGWLWLHFVFDAGLHARAIPLGALADLIGDAREIREALLTARELLPVLEARGVDLRRHRRGTLLLRAPSRVTAWALTRLIVHVAAARISLEQHADPAAAEPRAVCRDALQTAHELRVAAPRLESVAPQLELPGPRAR